MDTGDVVSDMLTILVQRLRRGVAAQLRPFGIYGDDLKWFTGNVQDAGCAGARQRLPNRTVAREVHIKAVSRGRHVGSAAIADPAAVSAPSAVESSADGPTSLPDASAARTLTKSELKVSSRYVNLSRYIYKDNPGGARNASDPLGIDLPAESGRVVPRINTGASPLWPCLHACLNDEAVRLSGVVEEGPLLTPAYLRGRGVTCLGWGRPRR